MHEERSPYLLESYNTKPVVETSSFLIQLEAHGCEVAQELLETPEVQRGFEVVKSARRLATLYGIPPPPNTYSQRKTDVEVEPHAPFASSCGVAPGIKSSYSIQIKSHQKPPLL